MTTFKLLLGDCATLIKTIDLKTIDLVLTDPPYPDYYVEEFKYKEGIIDFLNELECRQFIFWSAKIKFPLSYTACHVWDKITGAANQYDFIYERNGGKRQKVFRGHRIASKVCARFSFEKFYTHPSQKPMKVISKIIKMASNEKDIVFDPFMGSGTTGEVCKKLNRGFIGMELNEVYFKIAEKRINKVYGLLNTI